MCEIGIGNASTFTGFCAKHDDAVFAPIEKKALRPTVHAADLLALRSVARELHGKAAQVEVGEFMLARAGAGKEPLQQMFEYGAWRDFLTGARLAIEEVRENWGLLQAAVRAGLGLSASLWLELDRDPGYAGTGFFSPEYDFRGNLVWDISDPDMAPTFLVASILPGEKPYVVLSWMAYDLRTSAFINSLFTVPKPRVPDALTRLFFEYSNNLYASPSWWHSLDTQTIERLTERAERHPGEHSGDDLREDGFRYVEWRVTAALDLG